jgi:hypothetical protein
MMEIDAAGEESTSITSPWPENAKAASMRSSLITVAAAGVLMLLAAVGLLFVPRPGPTARFPAARFCLSTCEIKIASSTGRSLEFRHI